MVRLLGDALPVVAEYLARKLASGSTDPVYDLSADLKARLDLADKVADEAEKAKFGER